MNNKKNYLIFKILLIILFLFSQSLIWELALLIIPKESSLSIYHTSFQISAALYYALFCIFFSNNNELFLNFWNKHLRLKKIFNILLILSIYISIGFITILICIPAFFSSTNDVKSEVQIYINDAKNKIQDAKEYPIQMQCVFPVFLITIIAILLTQLSPNLLSWLSKITDLMAALLSLPFVLASVDLASLQKQVLNS